MIRWTPYSLYFCAPVFALAVAAMIFVAVVAIVAIVGPWVNQS